MHAAKLLRRSCRVQYYRASIRRCGIMTAVASSTKDLYFVFMDYDPEYERMRSKSSNEGEGELDLYLSKKHDSLLAKVLEQGTYTKRFSWVIIDGFGVEITNEQANRLRSAEGVRLVDKNLEFV